MNRQEFVESIKNADVDKEIKDRIVSVYGKDVPELILKLFSKYPRPELFDENESRTLSLNEVLNAEEDNGVPFKSKKIIPVSDKGDNDYIVYDGNKKEWAIYNIVDETIFNENDSFEKLFLG